MSGGPAQAALSERSGFRPPSPRFFFSSRLLFLLRSETGYRDALTTTGTPFPLAPCLGVPLLFFYFILYFLHPFCSPRRVVVWETDRFDSTGHIIASETEEVIFRILGTSDRGMICCMICLRGLEDAHDLNEAARAPAAGELQALAHFVFIRVILS